MKINVEIQTRSPLLVSETSSRLYDKAQKGDEKRAFIPGSAFKGALRETADTFESFNDIVCSLFGSSDTGPGKLYFTDILCHSPKYINKTHVTLSRKTRSSKQGSLFTTYALESGHTLNGCIYTSEDLTDDEKRFLTSLSKVVKKIGGMKSAGYGLVDIKFDFIDEKVSLDIPKSKYYVLKVKANTPFLNVIQRSKTYLYRSSNIISGETLRGAFASILKDNSKFEEMFYDEKVKFPTLYPTNKETILMPVPDNVMIKKYGDPSEGVYDMLIPKIIEKILLQKNYKIAVEDMAKDGARLETAGGYFDLKEGCFNSPEISETVLYTQTAVDRKTRSTKAGQLRSYITQRYDYLSGIIKVEDEKLSEEFRNIKNIFIGGSRSRGFGVFEISYEEIKDIKEFFVNNIKSFNEKLNKAIKLTGEEISETYIPVYLTSDMIIPNGKTLESLFEDYEIAYTFIKKSNLSGWNSSTDSPKPKFETIKSGGVIVLKTSNDNYLDKLSELFIEGIGLRTGSGFGSFMVYDVSGIKYKKEAGK